MQGETTRARGEGFFPATLKGLAEAWGRRLDQPGTFLGVSLTSQAFPLGSQEPMELGGKEFSTCSFQSQARWKPEILSLAGSLRTKFQNSIPSSITVHELEKSSHYRTTSNATKK